jgi:hypothetical protein
MGYTGRATLIWALAGTFACPTQDNPPSDTDGSGAGDAYQGDDSGDADQGDAGGDPPIDDFPFRTPQARTVPCASATATFWDTDHVCHVTYDTLNVHIYVQATPTDCEGFGIGHTPVFGLVSGWIKRDGSVFPMAAHYDWGGNHHNDSLYFTVDGDLYLIWHSSTGFGWRACAPPDCLMPCASGTTSATCDYTSGWQVDGCDREAGGPPPPYPVICVLVAADGSVPALLDPWQAQASASDYPLLPCAGDQ